MIAIGKEIFSILIGLGVNETVYYQLAIFIIGYTFLYFLVFKPYFRMLQEREKRTVGNQDLAGKIVKETQQLESEYQVKARKLSAQYKEVYDQYKKEAISEYDKVVNQARLEAKETVEKTKQEIKQKVSIAKTELVGKKTQVAEAIVTQVLGKTLLFIFVSIAIKDAYAASGEGIPWGTVGPQSLNFVLFISLLIFLLRKRVKALFLQREQDYTQFFRKAEIERDKAEKQKLGIIQRLKTLEKETQEASQRAQNEAKNLKSKILSEAHSVSERYLKEAQRAVQYELDKTMSTLRGELLFDALNEAQSLLKERVDTSTQRELNGEFIKKIQAVQP